MGVSTACIFYRFLLLYRDVLFSGELTAGVMQQLYIKSMTLIRERFLLVERNYLLSPQDEGSVPSTIRIY